MKRGFTLIELIIIMALVASLVAYAVPNLLPIQNKASLNSTMSQLVADIKLQQFKAMSGDTEGTAQNYTYGVYVAADSYVLFRGTYSPSESSNTIVSVDVDLSTTFPSNILIFSKGSGEIQGYSPGSDSITLAQSSESKTIYFNRYGVITSQD